MRNGLLKRHILIIHKIINCSYSYLTEYHDNNTNKILLVRHAKTKKAHGLRQPTDLYYERYWTVLR